MSKDSLINLWQCKVGFKVSGLNKSTVVLPKNSLLFLLEIDGPYYVFKTEDEEVIKLHKDTLGIHKVEKVF